MNSDDVHILATSAARFRLKEMLDDCTPPADCLHLFFANSTESRSPDGTVSRAGPRWGVGWNVTNQIAELPYWVDFAGLRVFFPQTHLYEEVSGKTFDYNDGKWTVLT
jgi:hypothetical protein